MIEIVRPGPLHGSVAAPPSKSHAHRLLICAALSEEPTVLENFARCDDLDATISVLKAMGAAFSVTDRRMTVTPIPTIPAGKLLLDVGESGSTLRFLLPVLGALGIPAEIKLHGRLPQRPMEALIDSLKAHGMSISRQNALLSCSGQLTPGEYSLPGDVSSQFVSGLLFALPLLNGDSVIRLTTPLQSAQYVTMTRNALSQSGILVDIIQNEYHIPGSQTYHLPPTTIEGDWSSAANFLAAGALSAAGTTISGLKIHSSQPDSVMSELLQKFRAEVDITQNCIVHAATLQGTTIDASQCPDLVPILAVLGAAAEGETRITNAARLRLKESDRLAATAAMLQSLGGKAEVLPDGLRITGTGTLRGGEVPPSGDHRIVMAAAVAATICREPVIIPDAQCVTKSYPDFFRALTRLKGTML